MQKPENKHTLVPKAVKVLNVVRETHDNFTLTLGAKMKHEPGQFVQVSILGVGEVPISIASHSNDYIKLNIHEVGNVTKALSRIKKNDKVFVRGPYGKGYPMKELVGNNLVIIGGGCGVSPLRGIIKYVEKNRDDYKDVMMFLGFRSPDEILFERELEEWKKKYNIKMSVDQAPKKTCFEGYVGFITELLDKTKLDNRNKVVFVCGPPIMMKKVIEILKKKGFHDDQIFISSERLMYCAFGLCCHCMIKGKFTCMDGPVFRYGEIKGL